LTPMLLCLDIGGSTIKPGFASAPNALTIVAPITTPQVSYEAFLAAITALMPFAPEPLSGIALSITGVTDAKTGCLTCANIPNLHGRPLATDLEQAAGLPVRIYNDADCFALAEATLGGGKGHANVLAIILGSGVGGALVVQGRVVTSPSGYAGEWGHGTILATTIGNPPKPFPAMPCGCGRMGCVNTVGGARGLEALHRFLCGEARTSRHILAGWHAAQTLEAETVAAYLELVSQPLAYALNITGSSVVVAGGGLASDHRLIAALDEAVRSRLLAPADERMIIPARLGAEAGLRGAALAGFQELPYA
jgi:N-acetylglucosamine kinase